MKTRRGVTFLELLFGLTVIALVASIGTATLSILTRTRSRTSSNTIVLARDAALRRAIIAWLEGAHASVGANAALSGAFQLTDASHHGRDADILVFTTSARTPLGTPETTVRLTIAEDSRTGRGLIAELSSWPGGPASRVELDSTIVSLDVRCLTTLLGGRRWVPSWMSTSVVPRGIEVRLRGAVNQPLSPILGMPIVVAVEGGR